MTGKQRAWVFEYPKDWNGTAACRRAGYQGSDDTLGVMAYDNLRNPKIVAVLKRRLTELAMDADEVLARLADHARGSMDDFIDEHGDISVTKARENGKLHLLHSYAQTERGTRIEIYDAQTAQVHLGRHHALFTDKVEFDPSKLTDDQLKRVIAQLAHETGAAGLVAGGGETQEPGSEEPDQ